MIELVVSLLGVIIDLMHLMKPGGFDVSSFFCDIISPPNCESELGLQLDSCNKLEDLKRRVRAKEQKKRAISRWGEKNSHFSKSGWIEYVHLLIMFPHLPHFLG